MDRWIHCLSLMASPVTTGFTSIPDLHLIHQLDILYNTYLPARTLEQKHSRSERQVRAIQADLPT